MVMILIRHSAARPDGNNKDQKKAVSATAGSCALKARAQGANEGQRDGERESAVR